ncbi:MAG: A/G-specific adenine glycosylase [Dehalococcoidia bacterium]|nr:A/G-specific adenine glycosylase [Dehalococcoidia bacterium]
MPWRRTRDPYLVLVSEVMLQQTQVSRVLPKYEEFRKRFPTVRDLAEAPVGEVIRAWAPLGYNLRAVRLHRAAQAIVERHGGEAPKDLAALRALPGIGEYSAAAMACFAFDQPVVVVDTNVRRVVGRVVVGDGAVAARTIHDAAQRLLPRDSARDWHLALMDLGATVCTARNPACRECPLRMVCTATPTFLSPKSRLAESRGAYRVNAKPFIGSRRYFRGRVVQALRDAGPGGVLRLSALGRAVKPGFTESDLPWLAGLVEELVRDGLVELQTVPWTGDSEATGASIVRLPRA